MVGKRTRRVAAAGITAALALAVPAQADVLIDFEDLALDTEYVHDDVFTSSGVDILVDTFFWSNGQGTDNGFSRVENGGLAGGAGQELQLNNVNLDFMLPADTTAISVLFGEYGGNVNLSVNGVLENEFDFDLMPGTIGGVDVDVQDLGGALGMITLTGDVTQFAIGGQELWIDNVLLTPGAGAGAVLLVAAGLARGRRRQRA